MRIHRLLAANVAVASFSALPTPILALTVNRNSNPVENLLDNVLKIGTAADAPSTPSAEQGKALLKKLDIQSNTEPRPFSAQPQQLPALLTASMPALFRLASGIFCNGYQVSIVPKLDNRYSILSFAEKYQIAESSNITPQLRQREPLVLYEFEACPYCRKVREAVSMLSLDVTFRPCPPKGYQWRYEIKQKYGQQATFPFLIDPNTNAQMFESDMILEYLFSTYGNGKIPWTLPLGNPIVPITESLGLLFRGTSGGVAKPSNPPPLPLKLWSYEGSPFCKLVKEKLSELELEHTQISCPRGSSNRQTLFEQEKRFQVPYLQDPNTGVSLFESEAIVEYLEKQYSVARSPVKYL